MRNILLSKVGGQVRFVGNCRLTPQMWSRCTSRTYFYYYLDHDDSDDHDEDDYDDDNDTYIMPECIMYLSLKKVLNYFILFCLCKFIPRLKLCFEFQQPLIKRRVVPFTT